MSNSPKGGEYWIVERDGLFDVAYFNGNSGHWYLTGNEFPFLLSDWAPVKKIEMPAKVERAA